jgi:hypothetical protein
LEEAFLKGKRPCSSRHDCLRLVHLTGDGEGKQYVKNTPASWLYTPPAFGRTGRSLSENNFAKEKRSWLSILLREILQNGLDARVTAAPVVLSIKQVLLAGAGLEFLKSIVNESHLDRFHTSTPHITEHTEDLSRLLVIEDFGTSGLIGRTDAPDRDGKGENWNAFWFREGEGGKEQGIGNGGAGQGKITYFSTSAIRTMLAYTVRATEPVQAIYGASSFLRDYLFNDQKWLRDSYWGVARQHAMGNIAVPSDSEQLIQAFRDHFGFERGSHQAGLSLAIPAARTFELHHAIAVTIAEFYAPILRGDLIVRIDGTEISSSTVDALADEFLSDAKAIELGTCTTAGFRRFLAGSLQRSRDSAITLVKSLSKVSELSEGHFDKEALDRLRDAINSGEAVSVRFPVIVKRKTQEPVQCTFDVHLQCPDDIENTEEAVIRKDLLIGEEPIGGGALRQRARGLTLISDDELSRLLLSAEEPTHLKWNARLPKLREYYQSGPDVVSFVRNAMSKLLELLTGGDKARDFRVLAKYFAAPGSATKNQSKGKRGEKGKEIPPIDDIPAPVVRLLKLAPLSDGCRVTTNASCDANSSKWPLLCDLEFAYEGLDKDAFAEYDIFDFDIADNGFSIVKKNVQIDHRSLNRLSFQAQSPDFSLEVRGFDPNLRLRMRLKYEEVRDGENIGA